MDQSNYVVRRREHLQRTNWFSDHDCDVPGFLAWCSTKSRSEQEEIACRILEAGREYTQLERLTSTLAQVSGPDEFRTALLASVMLTGDDPTDQKASIGTFDSKKIRHLLDVHDAALRWLLEVALRFYAGNDNRFKFYHVCPPLPPPGSHRRKWWQWWNPRSG